MKRLFLMLFIIGASFSAFAQKSLLQSGPMLGYSEMKEVMIWVQTKQSSRVKIDYTEVGDNSNTGITDEYVTNKENAFIAKILLSPLEPGKKYSYNLFINGKKISFSYPTTFITLPLWKWRTSPPDFSFATGSGAYISEKKYDRPGKPYGGDYQIFNSIYDKKPDFMLWLGDNIYLREPDWNTKTGIYHRNTHSRSLPELQPLLSSVHNYAIWDDHDAGPDNCDRSFWNITETFEAFKDFWANPSYGVAGIEGVITSFQWNDADFFLLDNRTYRTPNKRKTGEKTMLGKKQLEWLKDVLVSSRATFKFVVIGGQFLNPTGVFETYSNNGFAAERQEIINYLHNEGVSGVIFITGDRHHTEFSILERKGYPKIYDITVSPFTSGASSYALKEKNTLRVEGSLITQRNFAVIKVNGKDKDRKVTIEIFDTEGKSLWTKDIGVEGFMSE